jgi:transcriptional regulator with XRE-family HTH domain
MLPNLRQIRLSRYLTQKELAAKSGLSRVAVARLEAGAESARFSTLRKLAEALGVEPGELLGEPS